MFLYKYMIFNRVLKYVKFTRITSRIIWKKYANTLKNSTENNNDSINTYYFVQRDLKQVKDTFMYIQQHTPQKVEPLIACIFCIVPFFRRFLSVDAAIHTHEIFKTIGKAFLTIINLKGDFKDIRKAFKQLLNFDVKNNQYQRRFGFLKDTYLDNIYPKNKTLAYIVDKAHSYDKTLFDLEIVEKFLIKMGLKGVVISGESLKVHGNVFVKVLSRALMRMPILSLVFLGLLELPAVIKTKHKLKQIKKSITNITLFITFGTILGTLGAYLGTLGSLIGLGIGSYLGNKTANKINQ